MGQTPQDRYHFKPFIGSSHSWALQQLFLAAKEAQILDIGAGGGVIGQTLQSTGYTNLFAVEVDPDARAHIKSFYQKTAENLALFNDKVFDIVIMLDVIEHLADPFKFFHQAMDLLKPGGMALLSVPNIAHWSVRLSLLAGRFEYNDKGILDRTHLQFFTQKRLKQLVLSYPRIQLENLSASIVPLELMLPENIWHNVLFEFVSKIRLKFANLLPGLCAYQHLAVLKKSN